jgi:hypothetical protein
MSDPQFHFLVTLGSVQIGLIVFLVLLKIVEKK